MWFWSLDKCYFRNLESAFFVFMLLEATGFYFFARCLWIGCKNIFPITKSVLLLLFVICCQHIRSCLEGRDLNLTAASLPSDIYQLCICELVCCARNIYRNPNGVISVFAIVYASMLWLPLAWVLDWSVLWSLLMWLGYSSCSEELFVSVCSEDRDRLGWCFAVAAFV